MVLTWPVKLVVCADPQLMQQRAHALSLPLTLEPYSPDTACQPQRAGTLTILPVELKAPAVAGELNVANAAYVTETLARACDGCYRVNLVL